MLKQFFLFSCLIITKSLATLPSDITPCKAEEVECIAKVIQDILRKNPNGKTDLGLPNLEPFRLKEVILSDSKGSTGSLKLDLKFMDVDIFGLSKSIVDRIVGFGTDPNTSKFEIYATVPLFELKGQYMADGRILILPITGKGAAFISATNCKISIKFKPTVIKENGLTRIGVKHIKVLMEPSKLAIHLENLFNGDKILGENMNKFLNENWSDVWTELGPNVNNAMASVLKTALGEIFKTITYDDFYKKD